MKRIKIVIMLGIFIGMCACEKPDALKEEAFFIVENSSSSYDITGVYYAHTGYGSNEINSYIEPGESKTFTLDAEGDYVYNIMVTSNNPDALEYSNEDVHFYDDRKITIELTESDWETYYPW